MANQHYHAARLIQFSFLLAAAWLSAVVASVSGVDAVSHGIYGDYAPANDQRSVHQ